MARALFICAVLLGAVVVPLVSAVRGEIAGKCPLLGDPITGDSHDVEAMTSSGGSWHGGWYRTGDGEWKGPPPKPELSDPEQLKSKAGSAHTCTDPYRQCV